MSYRPIHDRLTLDPRFLALSSEARHLFYALKVNLGASGIDVKLEAEIGVWTGYPSEPLRRAFDDLAEHGWLRFERLAGGYMLLWLVEGLDHEPNMRLSDTKHVTSIEKHIVDLPKSPIVNDFCERYQISVPARHQAPSKPLPSPIEAPSKGSPLRSTEHGARNTELGDRRTENGEEDQKLNYRQRELRNLEIESNGFVPASDIPSVGAFLASINTAVAEREALDFEDISYTLNAFFPPTTPGAGTNPAVKAWLGRIPEQTISSALRYLYVQTYTVDGEEKTWGQLTDDHCKRLITAGLNAILRERTPA